MNVCFYLFIYVDISDEGPVVSEGSKVSQDDDFEHRLGKKLLNAEEKGASQRVRLTGANKRMFNLLKKAKVQLIKIDQQKQLKSVGVCMTIARLFFFSLVFVKQWNCCQKLVVFTGSINFASPY